MFEILDGKKYSLELKNKLKELIGKSNRNDLPILGVLQVGNLEESNIYIKHKIKIANDLGLKTEFVKLLENSTSTIIKEEILKLSKKVTGLIIQLPMISNKIDNVQDILDTIPKEKDIDGLSTFNLNSNFIDNNNFLPATAKGIILLLKKYNVNLISNDISIVGQSNIVGKPLARYLSNFNNTIRVYTKDTPKENIIKSSIVVVATGKRNSVLIDNIKNNAILVDVGIHRVDNKIYGDLDFEKCSKKASLITPVPGGVGPMTVIALMLNLIKSWILQTKDTNKTFSEILDLL
ncbi:tetrahydrofolate dehydrogenase/cyclohydrolase catalytic domain-containing protein [Metamycoplasma buccale]|uniref:tetrahydrofolate dehydrogenase/cyclohydrolase catalytic domain-containing protein n=1 Tax=Metamycoplasma buccale TaxID=55602 RepID=UPI00398E9498